MDKEKKTDIDNEATSVLLALRQKYWKQFDDKKTNKRKLWNLISQELIKKNFNVGENGGEKCRQKFCNLTKIYYAYMKNQKTTGEAGKDEPQFFQQMHSILGLYNNTLTYKKLSSQIYLCNMQVQIMSLSQDQKNHDYYTFL